MVSVFELVRVDVSLFILWWWDYGYWIYCGWVGSKKKLSHLGIQCCWCGCRWISRNTNSTPSIQYNTMLCWCCIIVFGFMPMACGRRLKDGRWGWVWWWWMIWGQGEGVGRWSRCGGGVEWMTLLWDFAYFLEGKFYFGADIRFGTVCLNDWWMRY